MTHDYKRHGTTTLLAALNILDDTVIGRNMKRHRHQEFIRFLSTKQAAPARLTARCCPVAHFLFLFPTARNAPVQGCTTCTPLYWCTGRVWGVVGHTRGAGVVQGVM
jgi:hypothetical protein